MARGIASALKGAGTVGQEPDHMPPIVRRYLETLVDQQTTTSVTSILADIPMIKTPEEPQLAHHARQVANPMMAAGRAAIGDGVLEFEAAFPTSQAGTRLCLGHSRGGI